jgi:MFS family permease
MSDASVSHVVHAETPDPRRWFALVVIGIAQLMVILDASIVNIALPHASLPRALGGLAIAQKNYQWAITAYTLTFGGFLLLGGRIGDYMGRKKSFLIGLLGFAGASLLGGSPRTSSGSSAPGRCKVSSAHCWHRRRSRSSR